MDSPAPEAVALWREQRERHVRREAGRAGERDAQRRPRGRGEQMGGPGDATAGATARGVGEAQSRDHGCQAG